VNCDWMQKRSARVWANVSIDSARLRNKFSRASDRLPS